MKPGEQRRYVEGLGFAFVRKSRHGHFYRHPCGATATVSTHDSMGGPQLKKWLAAIKRQMP